MTCRLQCTAVRASFNCAEGNAYLSAADEVIGVQQRMHFPFKRIRCAEEAHWSLVSWCKVQGARADHCGLGTAGSGHRKAAATEQ